MKYTFALLASLLIISSCSKQLKVSKESDFKRVPGTRILAKIPDTYEYKKKGTFLISEKETIMFNYGMLDFDEMVNGFDKDKFKEINHLGNQAYFLDMPNPDNQQIVKMLVINIDGQALNVVAKVNPDNLKVLSEVDMILASVKYDQTIDLNSFEGLPFYMELKGTGFQLTETSFNSFRFTKDGDFSKKNRNKTNILISDKTPMDLERTEIFAKKIRDMAVKAGKLKCTEIEKMKIGKYDALVYESKSDYQNVKSESTCAYLIEGDKTFSFKGTAFEDFEQNKEVFQRMIESFVIQ